MLNFSIISLTKLQKKTQKNTPDERFHACFPSTPQANKRDTRTNTSASTNTLAHRHSHTAPQAAQTFYWPGLKAGGMWWNVVCNGNNKGDCSVCASVCIWSLSVEQLKKPKPRPELVLESRQTVRTTAKTRQKNLWNSSLKAIAASIQMEFNSIALLTLDFFLYNNCILCGAASAQEPWLNDW